MSEWQYIPRGERSGGVASMTVMRSGHCYLSSEAVRGLGGATRVLVAARDGAMLIVAAEEDNAQAYRLARPKRGFDHALFCSRQAVRRSGLTIGERYLCIQCDHESGKPALYVRADVPLTLSQGGGGGHQEVAE